MNESGSAGGPDPGWDAPPPGPYGSPGPYGEQATPHPGWGDGYPVGPPKAHGKAIAILVLGISSLVACLGIPGIVALSMAPAARREIAASRGRLTGEGLIKAGVICSWISIALVVLVIIVFAIVATVVISGGGGNIEIRVPEPALEF